MKNFYTAFTLLIFLLKNKLVRFGFALVMLMFFTAFESLAQLTYTWNQSGTASWATAANWTPIRTTPAPNDILLFNNGATTTPTNVPTETIGQLLVSAATKVNLQGAAIGTTLTISGLPGDDLTVAVGSELNINVATNTTTIFVGTGATGNITGNMTFSSGDHRLDAADAGSINFNSPAIFAQATGCTGNVFTVPGTANAIVFNTATIFIQNDGANPFGLVQPASKVIFQSGSLYKVTGNSLGPSFSGRTYSNVEFAGTGTSTMVGAAAVSMDNLTITSGTVNINMTANPGHSIKGNINVLAAAFLNFAPASAGTINFSGTTPQSITNAGTLTFAANESVTLNNTAGLTLNSDITLNNVLTFTAGKITTGNNTLTITNTTAGAIVGADATKYVLTNGTTGGLKRSVTTAINSYDFPIGAAANIPEGIPANYKPATINFTTAPTIAGSLLARFKVGYPGFPNAIPLTEGALIINTVSFQGTWFLDRADGLSNNGIYTGTFTGNGAPDINDYTKLVLIKRPTGGTDWALEGTHVITTGSNVNPVLSRTGMNSFSEFAVSGQLIIALPVNLNYLNGTKQNGSNYLNWKVTCTNNPNVTMSLERSADKINFTGITSITADALRCQQPFDYSDNSPLAGLNYYRLKMTDGYGKTTYSAAIAILNKTSGFEIVSLMPSVVKSNAVLNVTAAQKTKLDVVITDIAGKQVQKIAYNVIAGSNQFKLNLANLGAGTYQITGYTADGEPKTLRFVKQ